jgi:hypothetical protein
MIIEFLRDIYGEAIPQLPISQIARIGQSRIKKVYFNRYFSRKTPFFGTSAPWC